MDSNEERVQKHVVDNSPGQRREVLTERTASLTRYDCHNSDSRDHGYRRRSLFTQSQ